LQKDSILRRPRFELRCRIDRHDMTKLNKIMKATERPLCDIVKTLLLTFLQYHNGTPLKIIKFSGRTHNVIISYELWRAMCGCATSYRDHKNNICGRIIRFCLNYYTDELLMRCLESCLDVKTSLKIQ
jgi:hypothetical protein